MSLNVGPTPERVAKATGVDVPIVDNKRRRQAFRMVDVIESMHRQGRLREEGVAAFRKFERDLATAYASSPLLSRYGEQTGGRGTPLSQLTSDILCPEERRADAINDVHCAAVAVGEPRTVESLLAIATREVSLELIGRTILLVGNKTAAIAAAGRTVQIGTYSLAMHYGYVQPPARASPS